MKYSLATLTLILNLWLGPKATAQEKDFMPLFDGKSLQGWHTYGQQQAGPAWEVLQGEIFLNPKKLDLPGRGDLVSDKNYKNFHLKLEWKISPNGNSGIMFNVQEIPAQFSNTYSTGPEMQIIDNELHPDAKYQKHRAGDLYDLIASDKEMAKKVGEWNLAEIIIKDGKLQLLLNGHRVVQTQLWNEAWKELLQHSKFATWPGFGNFKSGKIALQDHGDAVWFRNIRIKELP